MGTYDKSNNKQGLHKDKSKTDEILEKLEQGLKDLFESDNYKKYLSTMAKFHNYSFNNCLLIAMQKPDATLVAGYGDWQRKFKRQVQKGEKGITILAPSPYRKEVKREIIDPVTQKPVLGLDGKPKTEIVEQIIPAYHAVTVFDVSQTNGEPIPSIGVDELTEEVEGYADFVKALEEVSTVPVSREEIEGEAKGYFSPSEQRIVLSKELPQMQEIKTLIHEIAHSLLHNKSAIVMTDEEEKLVKLLNQTLDTSMGAIPIIDYLYLRATEAGYDSYEEMFDDGISIEEYESITPQIMELYSKIQVAESNRGTKEVQAESVAYVVTQHFGIDTSDYSFGYIAGWSSGKETKELKESMNTIRKTANEMITQIEEKLQMIQMEKKKKELEMTAADLKPQEPAKKKNVKRRM